VERRERIIDADGTERLVPAEQVEYSQCQEAVQRLTEYLSNELRPDEERAVQQHLSMCSGCFAKFHFEETLLRVIRERIDHVRAPGGLRERILGLIGRPDHVGLSGEPGTTAPPPPTSR
jgi:anti-sigma factor (TIGR02949 family)